MWRVPFGVSFVIGAFVLGAAALPAVALAGGDDVSFPAPVAKVDPASPPNALIASDGSGYYAISPDSDFRDDETGELIHDRPRASAVSTRRGPHLKVRSGGEIGEVLLPRGRNGWLDLGDGIRVHLVGRRAATHRAKPGEVIYPGALAGVDQRLVLDGAASSVEEWLIASPAAARKTYRWTLVLPRSMRATQRGGEIRVVDRSSGDLRLTITAPFAVDSQDVRHGLRLRLDRGGRGFSVRLDPRGKRVVGAVAIDPLYVKTNNEDYPTDGIGDLDEQRAFYFADLCGERSNDAQDTIGGNDFSENLDDTCGSFNGVLGVSPQLVTFTDAADNDVNMTNVAGTRVGDFEFQYQNENVRFPERVRNDLGDGITLKARSDSGGRRIEANQDVYATVRGPSKVGIWASGFRGHLGADYGGVVNPKVQCRLEIGASGGGGLVGVDDIRDQWGAATSAPNSDWPRATYQNRLFFSSFPYGEFGGGMWAVFPYPDHPSSSIGPGWKNPGDVDGDSGDPNTHMAGRFVLQDFVARRPAAAQLDSMPARRLSRSPWNLESAVRPRERPWSGYRSMSARA